MIQPGDHIKIRHGLYAHHGIYIGDGQVIHFSGVHPRKEAATIRYGALARFAGPLRTSAIEVVPYARTFAPGEVIARAKSRLNQSGFNLFGNNCEMFARWCKTGEIVSEQVEVAKAGVGGLSGSMGATAAGVGVVAAAGVVVGTSGPGIMSGLAAAGGVVGGGAATGVAVLAAAPAVAANVAVRHAFGDNPKPAGRRTQTRYARKAARTAGARLQGVMPALSELSARWRSQACPA